MDTLARLSRKRKLSRLCRLGAWLIAIIGVVQLALLFYNAWHSYLQVLDANAQIPFVASPGPISFSAYLPSVLANILMSIPLYLCLGILLYCASVIFEALESVATAQAQPLEERVDGQEVDGHHPGNEEIVYTSLTPEEIRQSRKTAR